MDQQGCLGVAMPTDRSKFDHLVDADDEEVTTAAATVKAKVETKAASQGRETATRRNRILRPKARQTVTAVVQREQRDLIGPMPPCLWCGLPTGCFCDQCFKALCSVCDMILGECLECYCRRHSCSEGQARQSAALLLKDVSEENTGPKTGIQHVTADPAFLAMPFEEQAVSDHP